MEMMKCPHCQKGISTLEMGQFLSSLRKKKPTGRPPDGERCPCGEMSLKRAQARNHRCVAPTAKFKIGSIVDVQPIDFPSVNLTSKVHYAAAGVIHLQKGTTKASRSILTEQPDGTWTLYGTGLRYTVKNKKNDHQ
jgi:hypothetical protein